MKKSLKGQIKKWMRALIVPMSINSFGIRDISRVLRMSVNTVLKTIKAQCEDEFCAICRAS